MSDSPLSHNGGPKGHLAEHLLPPPASPQYYPYSYVEETGISLVDVWRILVRNKILIFFIVVLSTLAAVGVAFLSTPIYRAEVLLSPTGEEGGDISSSITGQFGGLAALVGINLAGSSSEKTEEALATLRSRRFTDEFISEENLIPILFHRLWNAQKEKWVVRNKEDIPTAWDAFTLFDEEIRNVSVDMKTGLITLSIDWEDPRLAARWANLLVERLNRHQQSAVISEAKKSIAFLKEELGKTSVVEMQQAIYRLIEAQTKSIMLANVRDEYAFKVIDPAVPPEEHSKPRRILIIMFGFLAGLMFGMLTAFLRSYAKKQQESEPETNNRERA
jgi:uncharacterized protein involved in exopolysaccharide biosynthesis